MQRIIRICTLHPKRCAYSVAGARLEQIAMRFVTQEKSRTVDSDWFLDSEDALLYSITLLAGYVYQNLCKETVDCTVPERCQDVDQAVPSILVFCVGT